MLKKSDLEDTGGELPRGFINVNQKKGKWVFGSLELVSIVFLVETSIDDECDCMPDQEEFAHERCIGRDAYLE